jgi:hypothetical protein
MLMLVKYCSHLSLSGGSNLAPMNGAKLLRSVIKSAVADAKGANGPLD